MNRLYLLRHGQTDYNKHGRYMGSTDIGMNDRGHDEVDTFISSNTELPIDVIVSSPMLRCKQTAKKISEHFNTPIFFETDLRERNLGVYEGLTRDEAQLHFPRLWDRKATRYWDDAPTGGETITAVINRVHPTLEKLISRHKGENILMVSHGFVSKVINFYFNDHLTLDEFNRYSLGNSELHEFEPIFVSM